MDVVRLLNVAMWWNGRHVWIRTPAPPIPKLFGKIVRVTPTDIPARDVELIVLLDEGAVITVRGCERGTLWDFK
jgi:hypothetical protein